MPPSKVFLHIGAMKTGTTHLQKLMEANADSLDRAGYLFPVKGGWSNQVRAVRDVLGHTKDPRIRRRNSGAWQRLVDQINAYEGTAAILSMEFLSFAGPRDIERISASFEGAELHVILTVRDAVGVIPAQWQTSVRNGHVVSWPEFVEQLLAGGKTGAKGRKVMQRAQNIGRITRRWLQAVPPERFHVITVPPSGSPRSLLWERFASVIGADPSVCSKPAPRSNTSLGHPSTGLLRLLLLELGPLRTSDRGTIKQQLAHQTLTERAGMERRARTNQALREFAARKNQRIRSVITSSGVDLVGDLEDLPVTVAPADDDSDEIELPERGDILAAAEYALPRMRSVVDKRIATLEKRDLPVDDLLERLPAPGGAEGKDELDAAVKELAGVVRVAIDLRARWLDADMPPIDDAPTGDDIHDEVDAHGDEIASEQERAHTDESAD